jgi:hypothetical protein
MLLYIALDIEDKNIKELAKLGKKPVVGRRKYAGR